MNVKEMTGETLVDFFNVACRDYHVANFDRVESTMKQVEKLRAELLSRLSRGELAERKLAVAVHALEYVSIQADYSATFPYDNLCAIAAKALTEIEAMKE